MDRSETEDVEVKSVDVDEPEKEELTAAENSKENDHKEQDQKQVALKSTAVVKYASQDAPACFQRLHPNTDLNNPPSNWLYGNSRWESYIRQSASQGRPKDDIFSSFKMAHCFPELAGEVDVITDSENIKKLLKIPYSSQSLSLMVHRVGGTLLLDDFDVHTQLLRREQDDWGRWLRKFYYETVARDMAGHPEKLVVKKNKSRPALQRQNMFSKFLYYSLAGETQPSSPPSPPSLRSNMTGPRLGSSTAQAMLIPDLPATPEPQDSGQHQRNVVWTFEDLRMLVGTDLAIFGGGSRPAVSLHLRDARWPINVLTGLDYWLDNLMCNVPELAMCYHLNGIVQNYELIKTEEIPNLEQSKFEPEVIKDIAQNILSFLKSNATEEGHTYWLFKGPNDDIVKLYDLTTLCKEYMEDHSNNPFSTPVGILLYRVARNLCLTSGRKKSATIRTLLQNCLKLLDKDKHSQVVTWAHYLLSDLYVSDDLDNPTETETDDDSSSEASEQAPCDDTETEEEEKEEEENTVVSSVAVPSLCLSSRHQDSSHAPPPAPASLNIVRYPPIEGSKTERCIQAIQHIVQGLQCLERSVSMYDTGKHKVEEQVKRNPDEAIPLHYEPLKPTSKQTSTEGKTLEKNPQQSEKRDSADKTQVQSLSSLGSLPTGSWHQLSKRLLLQKAGAICFHLANAAVAKSSPVEALLHARVGLACYAAMRVLSPSTTDPSAPGSGDATSTHSSSALLQSQSAILGSLLTAVGDSHLLLATTCKAPAPAPQMTEDQLILMDSAHKEFGGGGGNKKEFEYASMCEVSTTTEESKRIIEHLSLSVQAYQSSLEQLESLEANSSSSSKTTKDQSSSIPGSGSGTKGSGSQGVKGPGSGTKGSGASTNGSQSSSAICLYKRLGNALNEHGVALMNAAGQAVNPAASHHPIAGDTTVDSLLQESRKALEAGLEYFDRCEDRMNQGLLHNNLGKLMRLCGQIFRGLHLDDDAQLTHTERQHFIKAAEHYQRALQCVEEGGGKDGTSLHASIRWELSSTYFMLAVLLQDHAPLDTMSQEQVEKEVTELMTKALKYCRADDCSVRQYRAATIHHRLASLYHNCYRNQAVDQKKKQLRSLAELHYGKAYTLFASVDSPHEMIRVQLERGVMFEFHMKVQTSAVNRLRSLQQSMECLLSCSQPFQSILTTLESGEGQEGHREETTKLLEILQTGLQKALHEMVKNSTSMKKSNSQQVKVYKEMYGNTLKAFQSTDVSLKESCRNMLSLLDSLQQSYKSLDDKS